MTLYRWDKYVQTKDNNWFLVDYDGREKKLICDELKELESKLVDDYFKSFIPQIAKKIDIEATGFEIELRDKIISCTIQPIHDFFKPI